MRSHDFSGMRTTHHKLRFCVIGFRSALKRYFGAQTRVHQGFYKVRRLKALEESDVGTAGGARANAMSVTGDVLGGLPTKRSQGLRGSPAAHKHRSEVGRIRGCCRGWTVLDGCCKERRHVIPGGREGSGNTQKRLTTREPSPF